MRRLIFVMMAVIGLTACSVSVTSTPSTTSTPTVTKTGVAINTTCSRSYLPLPDPKCTPGGRNPSVTQSTIKQTICVTGWTKTVRPSVGYTNALKVQSIKDYGYANKSLSGYEEDHFVPLELGGAPSDVKNLWAEPGSTPNPKDNVENKLHQSVCSGRITLKAGQDAIIHDWRTALKSLGL
jgi:hypothetical protein